MPNNPQINIADKIGKEFLVYDGPFMGHIGELVGTMETDETMCLRLPGGGFVFPYTDEAVEVDEN
jgi:hypothetical protein